MKNNIQPGLALESGKFIPATELSNSKVDPNEELKKQLLAIFERGIGFPVVEKKKIIDILFDIYSLNRH